MADKILIVDDDEDLRSELRDFLEGYDVLEAANGQDALHLVKNANEIALVILDIRMPGISGLEVLTRLKELDPKLHIIILTGYSSKEAAIRALKSHADDYVEKPININQVKESIERLLEHREGHEDLDAMDIKGKMERVKRFMLRNCCRKIGLENAAQAVALSPKYLSRIFKQETGLGFADFRSQIKIDKAKEFLEKTGYTVNQISEKLGYENPESFIRQFKKTTQVTPAKYRQKIKTAGSPASKPQVLRMKKLKHA